MAIAPLSHGIQREMISAASAENSRLRDIIRT
jgi:hypothetical protein